MSQFKRIAAVAITFLCLYAAGVFIVVQAQAPSTCLVSGTLYNGDGTAKSGVRLTITPVTVNGVLMTSQSFQTAASSSLGAISFTVVRGGVYNIKGNALGWTGSGTNVSIPSAATATLESLQAAGDVPEEGLTVKDEGSALASLIGTMNFVGAGVAVTQASSGVATVTIAGGGSPAWGSITGTLSDQGDLNTALGGKQTLDADLTAIAGLSPSNDDIVQRKAGAWINRTMAQLKTDLAIAFSDLSGAATDAQIPNTITLDSLTQITTRNYSDLQSIPSTFTPAAHATNHQHGGSDEVGTSTPGANAIPKAGGGGTLAVGWLPDLSSTYEPANANIQSHISSTSNPHSVTKSQVGLGNVENTALSTWAGTTNITTLGTIGAGVWNGTDVALAAGGTGASLADPGADRVMFWDDSAGTVTWLEVGSGLSVTDTTLTASGGAWSSLTAPSGNLTLAMGTALTEFNWDTGTGANNLFSLTTDNSSNGTGYLLNLATGTSSTVKPLRVNAAGTDALTVNASAQTILQNGVISIPSFVFAGSTSYGFYYNSTFGITMAAGGVNLMSFPSDGLYLYPGRAVRWNANSGASYTPDLDLNRHAANVLRVGNGSTGAGQLLIAPSSVTAAANLHVVTADAGTNSITNIGILGHETSGTPAAGFGTGLLFQGESTTTSNQDMAQVAAAWSTATHASRSSYLSIYAVENAGGLAEVARFDKSATAGNTGLWIWDADNGTLERVTVGAADSGGSGFKVLRIAN